MDRRRPHAMTPDEMSRRLETHPIVAVSRTEWDRVATSVEVIERHATIVAGDLLIVRMPAGLAAIEQPESTQVVVRQLGNHEAARTFVDRRLEQYERMWDGCGCKIDYFS